MLLMRGHNICFHREIGKIYSKLLLYIYILGVFTEEHYSKPLEQNVVYIPITTPYDVSDVKINHGFLQSDWTLVLSAVSRKYVCKYFTASV